MNWIHRLPWLPSPERICKTRSVKNGTAIAADTIAELLLNTDRRTGILPSQDDPVTAFYIGKLYLNCWFKIN